MEDMPKKIRAKPRITLPLYTDRGFLPKQISIAPAKMMNIA